jgi:hypothetical protein
MFKPTPNPPDTDPDPTAFDKAAKRALDFYLKPDPETDPPPGQLFTVVNGIDTECLLANLSETLASANAMLSDLAFNLEGSNRHIAFGVQQMVELSELLANRALDVVDPR